MAVPSAAPARQGGRSALLVLVVGAWVVFQNIPARCFATGRSAALGSQRGHLVARRAYTFGVAKSDEHKNLKVLETEQGTLRVYTQSESFYQGDFNTVLGDSPIPNKGRSYWEVKIVKKPSEQWEYIGVAEPTSDVTVPLTKNRKGAGWFWGSTHTESFLYQWRETTKADAEWDEKRMKEAEEEFWKSHAKPSELVEKNFVPVDFKQGDPKCTYTGPYGNIWSNKGTHVGTKQVGHPPWENGMIVGVDVDMDDGSLAFWADGKYLGKVMDLTGKPVDLKGKKIVPAMTVYGRKMGFGAQHTIMEVHTGMEAPARP